MQKSTAVYLGEALAEYHFGEDHPFGPRRHGAFKRAMYEQGLDKSVQIHGPQSVGPGLISLFHTQDYIQRVMQASKQQGQHTAYLDGGDTPAFAGVFEAASTIVGTALHAMQGILDGRFRQAFIPIAGLHHAARDHAAGFCVFNDCGVVIEALKSRGLKKILYVDIDAHHGDGVYYGFENDPALVFVDIHESGEYLYPGTGWVDEQGLGEAQGLKLNIPLPPGANDNDFARIWPRVEAFLEPHQFEFIILQCGADSLQGDPITHLKYSPDSHALAARSLLAMANERCDGRLLALGGGGYNLQNLASAWTRVLKEMIDFY